MISVSQNRFITLIKMLPSHTVATLTGGGDQHIYTEDEGALVGIVRADGDCEVVEWLDQKA